MKLGIMQPYFFPYLGYWQLIKYVDTYIMYDDVTYIKGGWINRNNFLISGQKKMYTINLSGASSYTLINEIKIIDDFSKFMKMLQANYAKAPFFKDVIRLITDCISYRDKMLGNFLYNTHIKLFDYLGLSVNILLSSGIEKTNGLKGKDKVIDICHRFRADEYINAIGGRELYDKKEFSDNGIDLKFIETHLQQYEQLKNDFISGLSIIDILMFNSKEKVISMLGDFKLI